ncbi:MAG: helix-turn-helix transcriptional regulator [Chitinophagaceae bacterium]|nr:helix-turn-helix transcriptional regulator [Rubrivivax sp.]
MLLWGCERDLHAKQQGEREAVWAHVDGYDSKRGSAGRSAFTASAQRIGWPPERPCPEANRLCTIQLMKTLKPFPLPRPSTDEDILRSTQLRLLLTERMQVNPSNWNYLLGCPFWRIYVNNKSGAFIEVDGKRLELRPGRAYCIPAWLLYQTGSQGDVQHDFAHFEWSGIAPGWLRHCIPAPVELALEGPLLALCHRWQQTLDAPGALTVAQHVWTQAWIYAVVAALLEQGGAALQHALLNRLDGAGPLRPALEQIDQSLAAPLPNPALAALCGMSTDYFIKCFKKSFGSTPAQYQLEQRITQAAAWLASTDWRLEDIAARAGFADRFHFSRAFSARLNDSPAAYRRKFRARSGGTPVRSNEHEALGGHVS